MTDTMLSVPWEDDAVQMAPQGSPPPQARSAPESQDRRRDPLSFTARIVADSTDRVAWLRARSRGITATDVARLATPHSVQAAAFDKLNGSGFTGNAFTDHGKAREPEIARWVLAEHGIRPSSALFHADGNLAHLATPDGIALRHGGRLELAEIKTTNKAWRTIPRSYLRQVWWQQYVLGAERTLVVWEQHKDFVPVGTHPECRWVDRDENEIAMLVGLADQLLALVTAGRSSVAFSRVPAST